MEIKIIIRIALITASILLVPLVAMLFTDEVNWGPMDFIVIGALLFGAGLAYELLVRRVHDKKRRLVIGAGVVCVVLYLWAELAVGIFTNWGS
jgi:hypothetical protein